MPVTPFLKSVTLTTGGTKYNLLTLIQALDPAQTGRCCKLQIQLDPSAGGATLLVGNDDISATNYGTSLVAGQFVTFENAALNVINASAIWLQSATSAVRVNVLILSQ
jgi:hypothetical protein